MGLHLDYNQGEVIWIFNWKKNSLRVENNIIISSMKVNYAEPDSGIYNIEIIQNGEVQTLFINDKERGRIILNDNILKIDDGIAAGGFITEFER